VTAEGQASSRFTVKDWRIIELRIRMDSMIHNQVEFHNVAELEASEGLPGLKLRRFPKRVSEMLEDRGRFVSQHASGCEIRFVTEAEFVRVTLSSLQTDGEVVVLKGNYVHSHHSVKAGVLHTLHLEDPPIFKKVKSDDLDSGCFSKEVWRIYLSMPIALFHGIDAFGYPVRPPAEHEKPATRWLAYGSSITQGYTAFNLYNSYIHHAARRLGVDVLNLGLGGACFCEQAAADFIATGAEWDIVSLELGINMLSRFAPDVFEARVQYMVGHIVNHHPDKPVVLITLFPFFAEYYKEEDAVSKNAEAYRNIIRRIADEGNHGKLYVVEGGEVLDSVDLLTADLVHPSDYGHARMGENLAKLMRGVVPEQST